MSLDSMQQLVDDFRAAFNGNNASGVAALYIEDGRVLPPGLDVLEGKAAIEGLIQGLYDAGVRGVDFEPITRRQENDLGVEVGRFTMRTAPDGEVVDKGKYVSLRREQPDGRWLIELDIFNSSQPPVAPPS